MPKSDAYASPLKNGQWVVLLTILGHGLPDEHPDSHSTKEAAELWIESKDGRDWSATKLARYGQ